MADETPSEPREAFETLASKSGHPAWLVNAARAYGRLYPGAELTQSDFDALIQAVQNVTFGYGAN